MLGKKAEGNRIARSVYELILQENVDDLEVHYEYNKLIRLCLIWIDSLFEVLATIN